MRTSARSSAAARSGVPARARRGGQRGARTSRSLLEDEAPECAAARAVRHRASRSGRSSRTPLGTACADTAERALERLDAAKRGD